MAKVEIPEGLVGKDLHRFLKSNKSAIVAEKKFEIKFSDAFWLPKSLSVKVAAANKAQLLEDDTDDVIQRLCVINTTNWLDSHSDVHIPGLWKKSLAESKGLYHLQEHSLTFRGIITDEVTAYTQQMSWQQLGLDVGGVTEALLFLSTIRKERNPYMFDQYRLNYVKNHSVGMRYVIIELAINDADEWYKEEFSVWNKYIGDIANREEAEAQGFFWAIREAKVIEGSAVPIGSNRITPTLSSGTGKQPAAATAKQPHENGFDLSAAIAKSNFLTH